MALTWLAFLAGASAAAATDDVNYNGGPVAQSMTGVIVDWGPNINPMYTNAATGDPGLIRYLASQSGSTSDIGGVLAQYMDSSGHNAANSVGYGGQYAITPSTTATTLMDSQIQSELINQVDSGALPHPAGNGLSTIYLVLFPQSDTECISSSVCSANAPNAATQDFCAYHNGTSLPDGTNLLYAVLPDDTTGHQSQWCGSAPTVLGDQTSYLTHEWSETVTDPLGSAWWVTNSSSADNGNEVGDSCNQIMTSNGGWTVQTEWSNLDHDCMGAEPAYSAPTASFLAPTAGAPGQQLSFDGSSSSDPATDTTAITGTGYSIGSGLTSYSWNWGDGTGSASPAPTASHSFAAPGTYQVSLTVTDRLGFTSTVTKQVEVTSNGQPIPTAATGAPTAVSTTAATLNGSVNPESLSVQYRFDYGTSLGALTQSTPVTPGPAGTSPTTVSSTLTGLQPSTTYYYELEVDTGGLAYTGSVQSFTTPATAAAPPPPPPPVQKPTAPGAMTGAASQVTSNSASVSGTLTNARSYLVEFGPSTAYGHSTPAVSVSSGSVSVTLSGLRPNTFYHYRLVATNSAGTTVGGDRSFRTARAPGPSPRFSFVVASAVAARAALHGRLKVRFSCSRACTSHFVVTVGSARATRFAPVAVTLARATGRIRRGGSGRVTLRFLPGVASRLTGQHRLRLAVYGYAVAVGSARSTPTTRRLILS